MNKPIKDIFKSGLVGLLAVVVTILPFTTGDLPQIYLLPVFVIYSLIGFVYSRIKKNLTVSKRGAFLLIFLFDFVISSFLPNIEGEFYLQNFAFLPNLLQGLILSLGIVSLIFLLWKQEDNSKSGQIKSYFASRSLLSWIWRTIAIMLIFFILTIIVGIISMTITGGALVEELMKVPSFLDLFLITIFRSFFFLLVTVPIIIFWKSNKKELFLYIALITSLIYPILGDGLAYMWPVFYRLIDGTALILHTIIMSLLYVKMLSKYKKINQKKS